jgi:hypothetical protein
VIVARFQVRAENVNRNHRDGRNLRVVPAVEPDGSAAVAVLINGRLLLVLNQQHALKLSDGVVDALEEGIAHG